jgi:hypothetical protein
VPHLPSILLRRRPLTILLVLILAGSGGLYTASTLLRPASAETATRVLTVAGDVRPGGALTVSGAGFPAGQHITLALNESSASHHAIMVAADGTFTATVELPTTLEPGRHAIRATDSSGAEVAIAHVTALLGQSASPAPTHAVHETSIPGESLAIEPPTDGAAPEVATPAPAATPAPVAAGPVQPTGSVAGTPAPSSPPPHHAPMPGSDEHGGSLDCAGYPEPRVWVESQDWWSPIPKLGGLGHMHMGMCFPAGQVVAGVVPFDVRVVLHHNAGTLTRIKMQDDNSTEHAVLRPNRAVGDGMYWFTLNIDTRNMPDGMRLFRFYADLEHPNGNTQTARPILPLQVDNGGGGGNDHSIGANELRATAWYKEAKPELDWGYVGAVIENYSAGPHVGSAAFSAKCFVNGEGGGDSKGSPALASWSVHVDPDFHNNNPGIVVAQGTGQLNGNITVPTGGLSHGWHRLVVRCNQVLADREHSAVGVFSIMVDH